MKRYGFVQGKLITQFESVNAVVTHLVHTSPVSVVCMRLGHQGVVGYHQATDNQLFLVVEGNGWVRGESPERMPIMAGQAAIWEADEWHESGTEDGMVAIVVEGKGLQLGPHMQPLDAE